MEQVKVVGSFFGIDQAQQEQWKKQAEKHIKDGNFGISLAVSKTTNQQQEQEKFLQGVEEVLSRIGLAQNVREENEEKDTSGMKGAVIVDGKPLTLTTPSANKSLEKQNVTNPAYSDIDDITAFSAETAESLEVKEVNEISHGEKLETGEESTRGLSQLPKEIMSKEDLISGRQALKHYKFYKMIEEQEDRKRMEQELENKMQEYDWKLESLDELIELASAYYDNPTSNKARKWRKLKRQVKKSSSLEIGRSEVRFKLGPLPDYPAIFTYAIMLIQVICLVVICSVYGITYIGVQPKMSIEYGVQTFLGLETVHKWTPPNVWIGPSDIQLIGAGAVFAPCLREDINIELERSKHNYSSDHTLGCCEIAGRMVAATTTWAECDNYTEGIGTWSENITCEMRVGNQTSVKHSLKPCCLGVKGQCKLMSHKNCLFMGGTFYQFGPYHCSQVNCLEAICQFDFTDSPDQWWRLPLSLLYHHGILELVLVLIAQWFLYRPMEHMIGWLRMMIIHLLAGYLSLMTASTFAPYESHVGAVGAVCGMLGALLMELFEFWSMVKRPWLELVKLLSALVLLLFCGTLPYLDIFGIISGFGSGALTGMIVLPFITFGRWHFLKRLIMVVLSVSILLVYCVLIFHVFVSVQSMEVCSVCSLLNCYPYSETMCESNLWLDFSDMYI